jgi:hypothetical protein
MTDDRREDDYDTAPTAMTARVPEHSKAAATAECRPEQSGCGK